MSATIQQILQQDSAALKAALGYEPVEARIEVQCLLQAVLNVSRAYLLAHPERALADGELSAYRALLQRRLAGEPVAYILGEREFFGLNFKVTPATLIPRPETELLVEFALQCLPQGGSLLDLGTGSGAIALTIAHTRPEIKITAVDASADALKVARENARRLGISNVNFIESDWFGAVPDERFDVIVSNPPYIAAHDPHLLQGDVRFEPLSALASGTEGLDDISRIVAGAAHHLVAGGWLLLEHGYDQAQRVHDILLRSGFVDVRSVQDLAGIERVTLGKLARVI